MRFRLVLAVFALAASQAKGAAAQTQPLYYCDAWGAYYPGVMTCPVPWRTVKPGDGSQRAPATAAVPKSFSARGDTLDEWCATVRLPSSIAICSDGELRALTLERQQAYDEARGKLTPERQKALLADQNGWVKSYPQACGLVPDPAPSLPLAPAIRDCMEQAGKARIAYLRAYGGSASRPEPAPPLAQADAPPPKEARQRATEQQAAVAAARAREAQTQQAAVAEALEKGGSADRRHDYLEAVRWYRLAADQGNAIAENNLGYLYRTGEGVAQDFKEAIRWYQKAADHGLASAQYNLGILYDEGAGVTQDYSEAMRWYRMAADQGNADARNKVGLLYENGHGVAQDYAEAMHWYRIAADQLSTSTASAAAAYNIGRMLQDGKWGVAPDATEVHAWMTKAAAGGSGEAMAWLTAHPISQAQNQSRDNDFNHDYRLLHASGERYVAAGALKYSISGWHSSLDITLSDLSAAKASAIVDSACNHQTELRGDWSLRVYLVNGSLAGECRLKNGMDAPDGAPPGRHAAFDAAKAGFLGCVQSQRVPTWSEFAQPPSGEPAYTAWSSKFQSASLQLSESCQKQEASAASAICKLMQQQPQECQLLLNALVESIMNGRTICDATHCVTAKP